MNVLLVDDETPLRRMATLMLRSGGHQVFDAATAAEALALYEAHVIDVLITDVVMQDMEGVDLARILTERQPQMPVIFISGYPMEAKIEAGGLQCRYAYLQKPFSKADLLEAVR